MAKELPNPGINILGHDLDTYVPEMPALHRNGRTCVLVVEQSVGSRPVDGGGIEELWEVRLRATVPYVPGNVRVPRGGTFRTRVEEA